jgi:hypothetical protein
MKNAVYPARSASTSGSFRTTARRSARLISRQSPGTWTNASTVEHETRKTGRPTSPSLPMVADSTASPLIIRVTTDTTAVSGKYALRIVSPGSWIVSPLRNATRRREPARRFRMTSGNAARSMLCFGKAGFTPGFPGGAPSPAGSSATSRRCTDGEHEPVPCSERAPRRRRRSGARRRVPTRAAEGWSGGAGAGSPERRRNRSSRRRGRRREPGFLRFRSRSAETRGGGRNTMCHRPLRSRRRCRFVAASR